MKEIMLAAAAAIGILLAVQASVNPRLARAAGSPYGGATLQLWVAVALLVGTAAATSSLGALQRLADVPGWMLLGGLASPMYITSGILLLPRVGALTAAGLFVAGQILGSTVIDGFGLLGVPHRTLTIGLVGGSALALIGIAIIVRAQAPIPAPLAVGATTGAAPALPPLPASGAPIARRIGPGWVALGLAAGAVLPFQGAVNAQLRTRLGDPLAVATTSFVVAALAITVVLAIRRARGTTPLPRLRELRTAPWWAWLGGFAAVLYVTGTFLLIPEIGASTTVVLTVTGQQLASAVIDARGAFGLPRRPLTPLRIAGLLLLVASSVVVEVL